MGLDCSHDAFHGAYSAFSRFRQIVCASIGGKYPPHYIEGTDRKDPDFEDGMWYWGEGYSSESHPGLFEFFCHSDCDGEISPEMCVIVANELELILPLIEKQAETQESHGHILRDGGYVEVTKRFITGCRKAAEAGEPLIFG